MTEVMFSSRSLSPLLSKSDVSVHVNYNKSEEQKKNSIRWLENKSLVSMKRRIAL